MVKTEEQIAIINAITSKKDNEKIVVVNAYSGCGKTATVLNAANDKKAWFKTGYMLAYNAKIAKENATKTPYWLNSRTIHSLAYMYIVGPDNLKVKANSDLRDFDTLKKTRDRHFAKSIFDKFCSSKYTTIYDFMKNETKKKHKNFNSFKKYEDAIKNTFLKMQTKKIHIPHNAYIKLFHLKLLHEPHDIEDTDILIIDEFGDANEVIVEIFKLFPAKKKVCIGDKWQNIYAGFNHTINGLEAIESSMSNVVSLNLTKSFRCSEDIAYAVNCFCINHIDKNMTFSGTNSAINNNNTFSYITRNNAALLKEIEVCMEEKTNFSLTRDVNSIFALIFMVKFNAEKEYNHYIKHKKYSQFYKKEFNYVMEEYNEMINSDYNFGFPSWILKRFNDGEFIDEGLVSTANLAKNYTSKKIVEMYNYAKDERNRDESYIITTAFSFKGGETDVVFIDQSLNKSVYKENNRRAKIIRDKNQLKNTDIAEMLLYYVACTRAKHTLINAEALDEPPTHKIAENKEEKMLPLFGDTKTSYGIVKGNSYTYYDFKSLVKNKQNILNKL